jgi:hypothetical protein
MVLFLLVRQGVWDVKEVQSLAAKGKVIYAPAHSPSTYDSPLGKTRTKCTISYGVYAEKNYLVVEETQEMLATCSARSHSKIAITYLPGQSTVYRAGVIGASHLLLHSMFWCLGIVLCATYLMFLRSLVESGYQEQRELWERGDLVTAEITHHEVVEVATDLAVTKSIVYKFTTATGEVVTREKKVPPFHHGQAGGQWRTGARWSVAHGCHDLPALQPRKSRTKSPHCLVPSGADESVKWTPSLFFSKTSTLADTNNNCHESASEIRN